MHVLVRLLKGYTQPLTYSVPLPFQPLVRVGSLVLVPLRAQQVTGVVSAVLPPAAASSYAIRAILHVHQFPRDERFYPFIEQLARFYFVAPAVLCARLNSFAFGIDPVDEVPVSAVVPEANSVALTDEQSAIVAEVGGEIEASRYAPFLVQGVTGSGKTEVYKALIKKAALRGKTTLFLCPEVGLARHIQLVLGRGLEGTVPVFGWHSAASQAERKKVWQHAVAGRPQVVVGVHLPALLPLENLGLIVVDEEHDGGFEEKQSPRINSKHAALLRARAYAVPIVLGSATPSIATLHHAAQQGWRHRFLTKRFGGHPPRVKHVILSKNKKRPHFWISAELLNALADTLFRGKQAIVYLNRRGYGFFLQCAGCGFIFECTACAVALTLHHEEHAGGFERLLECHYCTFRRPVPRTCPACQAPTDEGKSRGIGTQQLVSILQKLLPHARIGRADADTSRRKKEWKDMLEAFASGALDILVGTQIITKGFHFPQVTLVGVVWADSAVHFPVYNAHEVALQQLIQVAGRAGRACAQGLVIVQSFDKHPIFSFMSEHDYPAFCRQELEARKEFGYPPFGRLVTVELGHEEEETVVRDALAAKDIIKKVAPSTVQVLGPARPLRAKREGIHYRHILCKADNYRALHEALEQLSWDQFASRFFLQPL